MLAHPDTYSLTGTGDARIRSPGRSLTWEAICAEPIQKPSVALSDRRVQSEIEKSDELFQNNAVSVLCRNFCGAPDGDGASILSIARADAAVATEAFVAKRKNSMCDIAFGKTSEIPDIDEEAREMARLKIMTSMGGGRRPLLPTFEPFCFSSSAQRLITSL